jgi:uncharacterized membrane protein
MAKAKRTLETVLPWLLLIGGIIAFLASFMLTLDKIELIKNPAFVPECNLNPIISCGSVMNTAQASAFGFMNSLLGIAGFAGISVIGAALLAGAKFKRWFWLGLQLGAIFGVVFIHWLIFETIYRINALCPYCMIVWVVMIPTFWYTTLYNLRAGNIALPARLKSVGPFLQKHHADILIVWFLIILGMIATHFWYYWSTLI